MSAIIKNIDAIPETGWYDAKIRVNEEGVAGIIVDLPTADGGIDTKIFPIELIPEHPGRLIDDFAALRAIIKAFPRKGMEFYIKLEETIDDVPAIIEKEEEE